jgi:hypothetical protein
MIGSGEKALETCNVAVVKAQNPINGTKSNVFISCTSANIVLIAFAAAIHFLAEVLIKSGGASLYNVVMEELGLFGNNHRCRK